MDKFKYKKKKNQKCIGRTKKKNLNKITSCKNKCSNIEFKCPICKSCSHNSRTTP